MKHKHAFKSQGPATIMQDGTRIRVKRCRCGEFKNSARKLSANARKGA